MAETVLGLRVKVQITGRVVGSDGKAQDVDFTYDQQFDEGTGSNQLGNWFYDASRSLNATSEDIDLGSGGVTDFQGADVALTGGIKVLCIENLDSDTGDYFQLEDAALNKETDMLTGTSPVLKIGPKGLLLLVSPVDPYTIADGTADRLGVQSADNSTYRLFVAGDNA